MPTLTVTAEQADELHRLTYLEAASLLRQAADSLQTLAEAPGPVRVTDGTPQGEDCALHLRQVVAAIELVQTIQNT